MKQGIEGRGDTKGAGRRKSEKRERKHTHNKGKVFTFIVIKIFAYIQ